MLPLTAIFFGISSNRPVILGDFWQVVPNNIPWIQAKFKPVMYGVHHKQYFELNALGYITCQPGGCFTNVSQAFQNNLAKIYNAKNLI